MISRSKIALLYFGRSAEADVAHKSILPNTSYKKRKSLATWMDAEAKKVMNTVDLTTFYYSESNQKGKTFAERLTHAHEEIFQQGYEAIITVGNDCVELYTVDWENVISRLSNGECVLGPDMRNGAYLIGLTKDHFVAREFESLPWQTEYLFDELFQYCSRDKGDLHVLPELSDLNTYEDLMSLLANDNLIQRISRILEDFILKETSIPHPVFYQLFTQFVSRTFLLRAPPYFT